MRRLTKFGLLVALTATSLVRAQTQSPSGEPNVPVPLASDGSCASGESRIGGALVLDVLTADRDPDSVPACEPDTVTGPTTPGPGGFFPALIYRGPGSVDLSGAFRVAYNAPNPPQLSSTPLGLGFVYNSATIDTAMPGVATEWHFTAVDRVTLTMGPGGENDPQQISWLTGDGTSHTYDTAVPVDPVPVAEVFGAPESAGSSSGGGEWWYDRSGRPFSRFRYVRVAGVAQLERYRADGQVTRYEAYGQVGNQVLWRPAFYWDAHDNLTTLNYDNSPSGQGRLLSIVDPRGVTIGFSWSTNACLVTYSKGGVSFDELTWSFSFDGGERITEMRAPKSTYLPEPAAGALFDTANPIEDQRVFSITYEGATGRIDQVFDSRSSAPASTSQLLIDNTWVLQGGRWRVQSQRDAYAIGAGSNHNISYQTAGSLVTNITYVNPRGTQVDYDVDGYGRATRFEIRPGAQQEGKPRTADSEDPDNEPASVVYQLTYASCTCDLIKTIRYPSGTLIELDWDLDVGKLISVKSPNPAGSGAPVEHKWEHWDFEHFGLPKKHTPPAPDAETNVFYTFVPRSDGMGGSLWGKRYIWFKKETSGVSLSDGGTQTIASQVFLQSTTGRADLLVDSEGAQRKFVYYPVGHPSEYLLHKIIRNPGSTDNTRREIEYTVDAVGRVTKIASGPDSSRLEVDYSVDGRGRVDAITVRPSATANPYERRFSRDRWENVVVSRTRNIGHTGSAPTYADGTGSARQWVRREWHYFIDRLRETYSDRRALPEAANLGNPTAGADPWMVRYQFAYHGDGTLDSVQLPNGKLIDYQIDGYGSLYKFVIDPGGQNLESVRRYFDPDQVPRKTKRLLDASSSPDTFAESTLSRNWGGQGYLTEAKDPTGVITRIARDAIGRPITLEVLPEGGSAQFRSSLTYDEVGRVKVSHRHLLDASGGTLAMAATKFLYNARSQALEVEGDLGRKVVRSYDSAGRLKTVNDANAAGTNEIELVYAVDRDLVTELRAKVFEDVPGGMRRDYVTTYGHDLLGRTTRLERRGLDGAQAPIVAAYGYDTFGQITQVIDPKGLETSGVFDAAGRWIEAVLSDPSSETQNVIRRTASYVDNTAQTEVHRSDGSGFVTKSIYDEAYRLLRVERPGYVGGIAHSRENTYDPTSGRLASQRDGNGTVVQYMYDAADRVTARFAAPGPNVSGLAAVELFGYDGVGRVLSAETWDSTASRIVRVEMPRDSLGRPVEEKFSYTGVDETVTIGKSFDFQGGGPLGDPSVRRKLSYSHGLEIETTPDAVGRPDLFQIAAAPSGVPGIAAGQLADYRWSGPQINQRQLAFPGTGNYQTTDFEFDAYRRLSRISDTVSGAPSPVSQFDFEWDAAGNLIKEEYKTVGGRLGDRYDYDAFHRLEQAKLGVTDMQGAFANAGAAKDITYALDPGSNRATVTTVLEGQGPTVDSYTSEPSSPRYAFVNGTPLEYDGEGNLTFDGALELRYDFKNRLSEVYRRNETGLELVAVYGYDPMNRRVASFVPGQKNHRYAYDGPREVQVITPTAEGGMIKAKVEKAFVWGARLDELIAYHRLEGGTWVPYYPAQGKHDSVVALHRQDGALVERVEYDPYGKAYVYPNGQTPSQSTSTVGNPFLYAGLRLDDETGYVYARNRYLHTDYGRFLTIDPLGAWADPRSMGNGYSYGGNSPADTVDPFGLLSIAPGGGGGGGGPITPSGGGGGNLPPGVTLAKTGEGNNGPLPCDDPKFGRLVKRNGRYYAQVPGGWVDVTSSLFDANGGHRFGGQQPTPDKPQGGTSGWTGDKKNPGLPVVSQPDQAAAMGPNGGNVLPDLPPSAAYGEFRTGLDVAGFAPPPIGPAADALNALLSFADGDIGGGLLNLAAMIPLFGDMLKGASKGSKLAARCCDDVAVIGRRWDTGVLKGVDGHEVLDLPNHLWNKFVNQQWVQSVIDRGMEVYLASPVTFQNFWDEAAERFTVFHDEFVQFIEAGYEMRGDKLIPPGGK